MRLHRAKGASAPAAPATPPPFEGYDKLDGPAVVARLADLPQDVLREIDAYERAHEARPAVLNMLRYRIIKPPLPPDPELEARMAENRDKPAGGAGGVLAQIAEMRRQHEGG